MCDLLTCNRQIMKDACNSVDSQFQNSQMGHHCEVCPDCNGSWLAQKRSHCPWLWTQWVCGGSPAEIITFKYVVSWQICTSEKLHALNCSYLLWLQLECIAWGDSEFVFLGSIHGIDVHIELWWMRFLGIGSKSLQCHHSVLNRIQCTYSQSRNSPVEINAFMNAHEAHNCCFLEITDWRCRVI